jgi:AcrR family transcriptional regulator
MSRKANPKRPEELRDAIVQYLIKHGLADLSLRPLARAVGTSPRVLLYYFGSKEKMVIEVLAAVRERQRVSYDQPETKTFAEACLVVWKSMSAPDSEPVFRLFFEAYGIALRRPRLYRSFLHHTIEDWLQLIADPLCRDSYSRGQARAFATVVLAALRGFMLDYCATGDRKRIDTAVRLWVRTLDATLTDLKEGIC